MTNLLKPLLLVGLWAGGFALASRVEGRAWRPDELIVMRIQIGMFSAPEVDPESIAVASDEGAVRLTGVVPSEDVKRRIDQMVRGVEGVQSLDNALSIDAASLVPTPRNPPPDRTLQGDVTAALQGTEELSDSEIAVASVSGGTVVLGGYAQSLDDQLQALRAAKRVAGVRFVQNDMRTPPEAGHDMDLVGGQPAGADVRNRREQQALDGRAAETPPMLPGAPTPPRTSDLPAADEVEGHSH